MDPSIHKTALKLLEYAREYRKLNKEKISKTTTKYYANHRKVITCECGTVIVEKGKALHLKTKKHTNRLAELSVI